MAPDIVYWGQAYYLNDQGEPGVGVWLTGNLVLYDRYNDQRDIDTFSTLGGSYQSTYTMMGKWSNCYYSAINARTFDTNAQDYGGNPTGGNTCNPPPPITQPGPGGTPTAVCSEPCSPIVVDLSGRYDLSGSDDPVIFDLTGDGIAERTGWTARDSTVAFLAWDRNQDGAVTSGRELFGNYTLLASGTRAANGFAALAQLDLNDDGVLTSTDPIWARLLLWVDLNHNALSEPDELTPLASTEIVSIETDCRFIGRKDGHGNEFRQAGRITLTNGKKRSIYDVWLVPGD